MNLLSDINEFHVSLKARGFFWEEQSNLKCGKLTDCLSEFVLKLKGA